MSNDYEPAVFLFFNTHSVLDTVDSPPPHQAVDNIVK